MSRAIPSDEAGLAQTAQHLGDEERIAGALFVEQVPQPLAPAAAAGQVLHQRNGLGHAQPLEGDPSHQVQPRQLVDGVGEGLPGLGVTVGAHQQQPSSPRRCPR